MLRIRQRNSLNHAIEHSISPGQASLYILHSARTNFQEVLRAVGAARQTAAGQKTLRKIVRVFGEQEKDRVFGVWEVNERCQ